MLVEVIGRDHSGLQPSENCRWPNGCALDSPSRLLLSHVSTAPFCQNLIHGPPPPTLLLLGLKAKGLGSLFIRLFFFPPQFFSRCLPRALAGTSPRYQHSSARLSRGGPFNSAQTDNLSAGYCHRRPCITVCQCCGGTEPFARVSLPHWRWCLPPPPHNQLPLYAQHFSPVFIKFGSHDARGVSSTSWDPLNFGQFLFLFFFFSFFSFHTHLAQNPTLFFIFFLPRDRYGRPLGFATLSRVVVFADVYPPKLLIESRSVST